MKRLNENAFRIIKRQRTSSLKFHRDGILNLSGLYKTLREKSDIKFVNNLKARSKNDNLIVCIYSIINSGKI